MKFIEIPKGLIDLDLPSEANSIFMEIASAFFDLGYIDTNQVIASKYDISPRTVSMQIKLLETKGLIFKFVRKNGEYGIYRSRVIIPSKLGFQLLNMDTDKKWIIDQLNTQTIKEIENLKRSFENLDLKTL